MRRMHASREVWATHARSTWHRRPQHMPTLLRWDHDDPVTDGLLRQGAPTPATSGTTMVSAKMA
eukprot:2914782-Prymnesium_polylepis.1